jgi:hypothetical protein
MLAGIPRPSRLGSMAMDVVAQRLEMGDVILLGSREHGQVEARIVRPPHRTPSTVQATLRVAGRDDFVEEWPLGTLVTVVRGP